MFACDNMESIDEYIKILKIQLGQELSNKKLIYLDLNFWINLRKCMTNEKVESDYYKFYDLLLALVEQKKVLCPINHSVFSELLKQGDIESRINTAKVIDLFSNSVTLIFEFEKEKLELQYYIRQHLLNEQYLTPIEQNVWVKIPYVMGVAVPYNENIDEETQKKIQIEFFKYSWTITLEEMMKNYMRDEVLPFLDMSKTASSLNEGKFSHSDEMKTIRNLFKVELKGVLSVFRNLVTEYFKWLSKNHPEILKLLNDNYKIAHPRDLCAKIEDDILNDKIGNYLPRIYIMTCIYTLMRWDKERKFKANDLYDFEHARAALPYYQYFFTEGPLKHSVTMKPYELSNKYGCIVENEIKVINNLLTKMAS